MSFRFSVSFGRRRHQFQWPRAVGNDNGTTRSSSGVHEEWIIVDKFSSPADPSSGMLSQAQCPLFDLPTEIRLYIYELTVLMPDEPVNLEEIPSKHHLAILQTCRRVFHEAETIFYATHRFQCAPPLFRTGLSRRNAITRLTIVISSGGAAHAAITKLHQLPNLRSLYIQRKISIRYLNVSGWAIMARQMQTELAKLPSLREVKVFTPVALNLTPAEEQRNEKLKRVDAMLARES